MVAIVHFGNWFYYWHRFFLGSNIAIKAAGPAVLVTFLLAAIGTYIVYDVLSRMTADDPQSGSFSYYSKKRLEIGQVSQAVGCIGVRKC